MLFTNDTSIQDVIVTLVKSICEIRVLIIQGKKTIITGNSDKFPRRSD